ncbi:MAG TPA: sensor histidine kinase [Terriglobales bacterium]|nr:sensor histidine kinase [Terriglobales bacterium]
MSGRPQSREPKTSRPVRSPNPETIELSRHLLRAQEEERKRISRELHDETGQALMVLRFYVTLLADAGTDELRNKVQEAIDVLDRTIEGLRRIIERLSPRPLEEFGLMAAIRKEARDVSRQTGMKTEVTLPEQIDNLDHETEIAIYRSVQEALHNIAKHSQANSFKVDIQDQGLELRLSVEDNGVGFSRRKNVHAKQFGLIGMKERATALGGTVHIRTRKGAGTRVIVTLPTANKTASNKRTTSLK